jgi:hypothetical protein
LLEISRVHRSIPNFSILSAKGTAVVRGEALHQGLGEVHLSVHEDVPRRPGSARRERLWKAKKKQFFLEQIFNGSFFGRFFRRKKVDVKKMCFFRMLMG